ncbi:MAG: hypothetical protein A2X25_12585 [Chloroflexi bacterium GWB2_49_20]|nr:MAG: hypothetical protein A2X25_12585 [Chloroflexi bacterium GWB2_49_20]OGN78443.1 MAG: hypothetical protein A2X26_01615 [Chloroflexi bacterium GWC2_49_37]OGN84094.1 MAG: hypothetical protein A2X27_14070 [Chloroflexi bacterium GWD2_49_16]HBG75259.1 hypothetical protein [Anaerolineae bacterium]HCC79106.1 hypothetical protein [Anaerolineae bacterium]
MLDNLRNQDSSPFNKDEEDENNAEDSDQVAIAKKTWSFDGKILGLKSQQLFILLLMLLLAVCLLGTMLLLVTGKIVPTFF